MKSYYLVEVTVLNAWLLYPDRDADSASIYAGRQELLKDLNLDIVLKTMAGEDKTAQKIIQDVMMRPLRTEEEIQYRQEIIFDIAKHFEHFTLLHDFLRDADSVVHEYRDICSRRRNGSKSGGVSGQIDKLKCLITLTEAMQSLYPFLIKEPYESKGMQSLFTRFASEFPPERLTNIRSVLHSIEFWLDGGSITISAGFSEGLKLGNFTINQVTNLSSGLKKKPLTLREQISKRILKLNVTVLNEETQIYQEKQLEEAAVTWLLSGFDDYHENLLSFFSHFSYEAAFYLACANLVLHFQKLGLPLCLPQVRERGICFEKLYDISLAIYFQHMPVSNSLHAPEQTVFVTTGANQGGKSTWLRSIGAAQFLMQCGMPVPAKTFSARLHDGIFTHFTREEDKNMNSGRFDEELRRMDHIIGEMTSNSVLLINEAFASTTESEGALIMKNIISALMQRNIPVFLVTHLFEFTRDLYECYGQALEGTVSPVVFLSAGRSDTGLRTFKIQPEKPSPTSYGIDLYKEYFPETIFDMSTDIL